MNNAPVDLDERVVGESLADCYGLDVRHVEHVPKGFGSYHWSATTADHAYFVTVDDLDSKLWLGNNREAAFRGMRVAFDTAMTLHEQAGLAFVVAPIRARDGASVVRIADRYSLAVFPTVDGTSGVWGEPRTVAEGAALAHLLADLHLATPAVSGTARHAGLELDGRSELEAALREVGQPWCGGPFSEPTRHKLAAGAERLGARLAAYDLLAVEITASGAGAVITHGEPHPGNLMQTPSGWRLVDWDTCGLAPPERDLWLLDDPTGQSARLYTERTGHAVDDRAITLFRQAWDLKDLAAYVALFRSDHERSADTEKAWLGICRDLG